MRRIVFASLLTALAIEAALLPHVEEIAPGVWAAGFADKYGSANCGWILSGDETVLVGLPRGIGVPEFLAEVSRISGKPVRTMFPFFSGEVSQPVIDELARNGVRAAWPGEGIQRVGAGSLYLPRVRVLFAGAAISNGPRASLVGRNTETWLGDLDKLSRLGAEKVVPGYGTWGGPQLIERQRSFLTELRRQVAYGITMDRPLETITRELLLPASYYTWMPYDNPRPEDIRQVYVELTEPAAPFSTEPPEKVTGKVPALVLIGDRYHEPEHLEAGLRPVFEATGVRPYFTVDVRTLNAHNLGRVKLLVILRDGMVWPGGPDKPYRIWMTPEQENAVVDFVRNGGAFLNLHNSMGLYPAGGPFLNLVGGRYIGHGPLERFRVEVVDRDHPITRGVADFSVADEQHTPPYDENKVHLLLRNRSDDGKAVAAAGWAYEPGKGRLCHLANGHTRDALEHPMFQRLMRNAVDWCLRR